MTGNLGFGLLFNERLAIILIFIITAGVLFYQQLYDNKFIIFFTTFSIITFFSGIYESSTFSYTSTFHILMKVFIGGGIILIVRESFLNYYIKIILFFAVISLICFSLNSFGIIIPYISVENTQLDGGNIFRVSSLVYTQLYNINSGGGLSLRNCGPFWEPGAYQGFLNLALALMAISIVKRDKDFYIVYTLLTSCVITTLSTGGYIVLFLNLLLLLITDDTVRTSTKYLILSALVPICLVVFFSIDFLYDKLSTNQNRLGVSTNDMGEGLNLLFGYGYAADSFKGSSLKTASGLLNLVRYSGVCGFLLYVGALIGKVYNIRRFIWALLMCLILMNEPFLTAGPFWWGIPFILDYLCPRDTTRDLFQTDKCLIS